MYKTLAMAFHGIIGTMALFAALYIISSIVPTDSPREHMVEVGACAGLFLLFRACLRRMKLINKSM